MENRVRIEIESHRFVMQLLISIKEFVIREIDPYLELLNHLAKKRVPYKVVELTRVVPEWSSYLKVLFSKAPYKSFNFLEAQFEFEKSSSLMAEFNNGYPSIQGFYYKPEVSQISSSSNVQDTFRNIITTMCLVDQKVYVYYFKYAVVIEVSLHQLLKVDEDVLFNTRRQDVVVFPSNFEWVIAYAGLNLWYAGYKKSGKRQ